MSQTVAFFPGLLCDEALFAAQVRACEAAGYETYVADFSAAHHESVEAMAWDILADLPDRFSLVGVAMGVTPQRVGAIRFSSPWLHILRGAMVGCSTHLGSQSATCRDT